MYYGWIFYENSMSWANSYIKFFETIAEAKTYCRDSLEGIIAKYDTEYKSAIYDSMFDKIPSYCIDDYTITNALWDYWKTFICRIDSPAEWDLYVFTVGEVDPRWEIILSR